MLWRVRCVHNVAQTTEHGLVPKDASADPTGFIQQLKKVFTSERVQTFHLLSIPQYNSSQGGECQNV